VRKKTLQVMDEPVVAQAHRTEDVVAPIPIPKAKLSKTGEEWFVLGETEGVDFRFSNERRPIPKPSRVRIFKEGGSMYRIDFLYTDTEVPQNNGVPNIDLFDRVNFILITGVDEVTGKPRGRVFEGLTPVAWGRIVLKDLDVSMKSISCATDLQPTWQDLPSKMWARQQKKLAKSANT